MSIDWDKPLRTIEYHSPIEYVKKLDNIHTELHLVKLNRQTLVVTYTGYLPGSVYKWLENAPEEEWRIVGTTTRSYPSEEEAKRELAYLTNREWTFTCEKT